MNCRPVAMLLIVALLSCAPAPSAPASAERTAATLAVEPSMAKVILSDGAAIKVEIAADEELRAQGLMYRDHLDPDAGMLFLFPADGEYGFWMKNTRIALDMIWIDAAFTIVHVKHDVPPCEEEECPSYPPGVSARYVLELAAGEAARHKLEAGQKVMLEGLEGIEAR